MEVKGKVHEVGATQQVTESFKKRDLILEIAENPQFVEYVRFELTQDNTSKLDSLNVGDEVEVAFNLRGRPWTNKDGGILYFKEAENTETHVILKYLYKEV
jgi:hypothetical protein